MAAPTTKMNHEGRYWEYTPGSAVAAGDIIEIIDSTTVGLVGHASLDIAANEAGSLLVDEVLTVNLLSGDEPTLGALMYWDATLKTASITAGTDCLMGRCAKAWATGETTVQIHINKR